MADLTLRVIDDPPRRARRCSRKRTHRITPSPPPASPDFVPVAVTAYDGETLVGGIQGTINWNWLHIALFWISEDARRSRRGIDLAAKSIEVGRPRSRGCRQGPPRHLHLPSPPLLRTPRLYEVFATLDDYPSRTPAILHAQVALVSRGGSRLNFADPRGPCRRCFSSKDRKYSFVVAPWPERRLAQRNPSCEFPTRN